MACMSSPRLHLFCVGALAALLALKIEAVRLDGGAGSWDGSVVAGLSSKASIPLAPDSAAALTQLDMDLRAAETYIHFIDVQDNRHLGTIKDALALLGNIKERLLSFGNTHDTRHRRQIRKILQNVEERNETLKVLAGKLEAEGVVDDGGEELPTQRDNICSRISMYPVELTFLAMVQLFCESLTAVRKAIIAGESEEPMVYCVSGLLNTMALKPDYRQGDVGVKMEQVLGEERRWVAKHIAPRPAVTGNASPPPEGTRTRFRGWALSAWETNIWEHVEVDTAALPFKALKEAHCILMNTTVEDDLTITSLRTRISRIEFRMGKLVQFISRSDAALREQIRDALQQMKARIAALRALAARKLAAGEVDDSDDVLPSQRDNICTALHAPGLDVDLREEVRKICETFDRLHIADVECEKDKVAFEVLGRLAAIKRRPGYSDTPVASELENLFAEEWS